MIDWLWTLYDYSDGSGIQNLISGIPKKWIWCKWPRFSFLVFSKNFLKVIHYMFTVPKKYIFYVSINIWNIICCTIFKILNPLWEFEWSAELDVDFPTGTIRTNVLERDETRATSREAKMRVIGLVPRRHNSPLEAVAADLGFFYNIKILFGIENIAISHPKTSTHNTSNVDVFSNHLSLSLFQVFFMKGINDLKIHWL